MTEIWIWPDKDFKAATNILQTNKKWEIKDTKKNQMEILELKNTITDLKISVDELLTTKRENIGQKEWNERQNIRNYPTWKTDNRDKKKYQSSIGYYF